MPISDLSDGQLDNLEDNYRQKNKTEGGIYTLSEVLLEKMRRKPTPFGVLEVARKIIELATLSDDGLVTYLDIWNAFRPDIPWQGHYSQQIVAASLGRVVHYCITNRLPILTVLVVRKATRRLSRSAIENIYSTCRELGVTVGPDPKAFVDNQLALARAVKADSLPSASVAS